MFHSESTKCLPHPSVPRGIRLPRGFKVTLAREGMLSARAGAHSAVAASNGGLLSRHVKPSMSVIELLSASITRQRARRWAPHLLSTREPLVSSFLEQYPSFPTPEGPNPWGGGLGSRKVRGGSSCGDLLIRVLMWA